MSQILRRHYGKGAKNVRTSFVRHGRMRTSNPSPAAIAAKALEKALEVYAYTEGNNIDLARRRELAKKVITVDKLRFMNMQTLAGVLAFMVKHELLDHDEQGIMEFIENPPDGKDLPTLMRPFINKIPDFLTAYPHSGEVKPKRGRQMSRDSVLANFYATFIRYMIVIVTKPEVETAYIEEDEIEELTATEDDEYSETEDDDDDLPEGVDTDEDDEYDKVVARPSSSSSSIPEEEYDEWS